MLGSSGVEAHSSSSIVWALKAVGDAQRGEDGCGQLPKLREAEEGKLPHSISNFIITGASSEDGKGSSLDFSPRLNGITDFFKKAAKLPFLLRCEKEPRIAFTTVCKSGRSFNSGVTHCCGKTCCDFPIYLVRNAG